MTRFKLFLISLDRARERRLHAIRQLLPLDIPFEILDAVDAKTDSLAILPETTDEEWTLTKGEVACYRSHLRSLQRIVDYDLDYGIILEDDFKLCHHRRMDLGNVVDMAPPGADHIQLHNFRNHLFRPYKILHSTHNFNRVGPTSICTVGYIISQRLAKKILSDYSFPKVPIDHLYIRLSCSLPSFGFYDLNQRLIDINADFPSQIS